MPEICVSAHHNNFNPSKVNACDVRVGEFNCGCSICDSAQDVSVDCSGAQSLGIVAPFFKFNCVGLGLLGLNGGLRSQPEPFINPILLLGTEELERRKNLH